MNIAVRNSNSASSANFARGRLNFGCVLIFFLLADFGSAASAVADSLPSVTRLQVGFGNHYKLGCWTPVAMTLSGAFGDSGARGRLDLQAPDGDGVPTWFTGPTATWTAGGIELGYVRIGRPDRALQVRLAQNGGETAPELLRISANETTPTAVPATDEFVVEVENSIGLQEMYQSENRREARRTVAAIVGPNDKLPERWYAYEGVDLLVVSGKAAAEKIASEAGGLDAIEQWVRAGGTLILACSEGAGELFASEKTLARFKPGEFDGIVRFPDAGFGAIETFAAGSEEPRRLDARELRVPQWKNIRPERIALSYGSGRVRLPIIVNTPYGFGQIIFVGLDLHRAPFMNWPGRDKFLEKLIHRNAASGKSNSQEPRNPGKRLGFVDLSGQLRAALDQFDGVDVPPFWAVAVAAFGFILLLFPISYWLVTRWLMRPWLAWIILPSLVIALSVGAYGFANSAKGNQARANQVDLIDIDLPSGKARGTTWFNVFSPANDVYDFRLQPKFAGMRPASSAEPASNPLLGWFGAPGAGLGGMSSAATIQPLFDEPYTIDPEVGTIESAPIGIWSSKSFVARWSGQGSGLLAKLTAAPLTRNTTELRLHGTIENELGVPLEECVVFFGGTAHYVGTLKAEPCDIDRCKVQAARHYLSKRPLQDIRGDTPPPYDYGGFNVPRILEMMMFHERAGGANYTGLLNRYQSFVDLSSQLEFGRAILIGLGPPGATVEVNGTSLDALPSSRHDTIYRFLLPVQIDDDPGSN
jgi:hypothetical protein